MNVCLLAGGTGGAKLAAGLADVLPAEDLTVVTNTGDDVTVWGLHVSPDVDAVVYRLAGLFDEERGWGVAEETFAALAMMGRLGEPDWFRLGDRDLAMHVLRTRLEGEGCRPTEAELEIQRRLGLEVRVLPASDRPVRVTVQTDRGLLGLQEYFVRERCEPRLVAVDIEAGPPSPETAAAVAQADLVVIGPSNPLISINPVLAVLGSGLDPARTAAVSPIVAGTSLKGPTAKMLAELGRPVEPATVAQEYRGRAGWFVLDSRDADAREQIEALGYRVVVADTVMPDRAGAARFARELLTALT